MISYYETCNLSKPIASWLKKVPAVTEQSKLPLLTGATDVSKRHSSECRYKVATASDHTLRKFSDRRPPGRRLA